MAIPAAVLDLAPPPARPSISPSPSTVMLLSLDMRSVTLLPIASVPASMVTPPVPSAVFAPAISSPAEMVVPPL
jgi:hypothetical protein